MHIDKYKLKLILNTSQNSTYEISGAKNTRIIVANKMTDPKVWAVDDKKTNQLIGLGKTKRGAIVGAIQELKYNGIL